MNFLKQIFHYLQLTNSEDIVRRYFVVNGFDGAVTMLGLTLGFLFSEGDNDGHLELHIILSACLGAAIALGLSGVSSAYLSESAERRHALTKLEESMAKDLSDTDHGKAARGVPWLIALVNGAAPLIISLLIMMPLFAANTGVALPANPLYFSILNALLIIFLLGVFMARVAGVSKLRSGLQTLGVAGMTILLIYSITG